MKIGYARIFTADQNLDLQEDALHKAGCEKIFRDVASGAVDERVGLMEAIEYVRSGGILIVWKLDRLGRSLKHLIKTVANLQSKKIGFHSLQESIDTTTSGGKLIFHVFAALAEFERDLITERTHAGLASARARGRMGGRPKSMSGRQIKTAKAMLSNPDMTNKEVCRTLKVSKSTLYRSLKEQTR